MSGEWSDSKKWRMELLKSAIAFSVAAIASLVIIDEVQEKRAEHKARRDAFYTARLKSMEEFRSTTVAYDLSAHTAYTDLYQWKSRIKTAGMLRYEQEAYPRWVLSLETIQHLFPLHSAEIQQLSALAKERHKLYDSLVDERLDNTKEIKKLDPWAKRLNFDKLGHQSTEARTTLTAKLQSSLFPPEKK